MSVRIKRWFAVHDGGTKFYQVIKLTSDESDKGFVVTHWGPYSAGGIHEPSAGGQNKVAECKSSQAEWEADRAISAKRRRGYKFQPFSEEEFYSLSDLRTRLFEIFRPKDALKIHTVLTGSSGEDMSSTERDEEIGRLFEPPIASDDFIVTDSIPKKRIS